MPIVSTYTDVVRTIMTGIVSFDELVRHVQFLCSLRIKDSIWIELTDQINLEIIDISSDQASEIAQMAKPIHDKYTVIHNILITNTAGAFASDRMIETHISLSSSKPVWHFVDSREEAEELVSIIIKADANKLSDGT